MQNVKRLEEMGWQVLEIWECELKDTVELAHRTRRFLDG